MAIAFFISSIGDTDLAKATIRKLIENGTSEPLHLIPVTPVADKRSEDLMAIAHLTRAKLTDIVKNDQTLIANSLNNQELILITEYIKQNNITHAYIGVPSPVEEDVPYQIAKTLDIACTIAYEYMFTAPSNHHFWRHVDSLATKKNCGFAVALPGAKNDILKHHHHAKVDLIGHLSIEQAMINKDIDITSVKSSLLAKDTDELVFISGTTQPKEVDNQFIDAILNEIATEQYPNLQIRLGLHPGVIAKGLDGYLTLLLKTCEKYPKAVKHFKIIIPTPLAEQLKNTISYHHPFILWAIIPGNEASLASNKIAQAVPGALLNEAAIKGKPSYFHERSSSPYLPRNYFSANISEFFKAKPQPPHTPQELGIQEESAASCLAKLLLRS